MSLTLTSNSPSAGYIAWTAFGISYNGSTYNIAAGNTNLKYTWWRYSDNTIQHSNAMPTLADADYLLFLNKSGIGVSVPSSQVIDGSLIVSGSILADAIGANQVTAEKLAANSVTANSISAGAVQADDIAAGAITASKLSIGAVGDDAVTNGSFEDGIEGWALAGGSGTADIITGVSSSGAYALRLLWTSGNLTVMQTSAHMIPVTSSAAKRWYICCVAGAGSVTTSGFYLRVFWFLSDKVTSSTTAYTDVSVNQALATTWKSFEGQVSVPSDARYMAIAVVQSASTAATYIDSISANEVTVSAQIANGAITTALLAANAVTADQLAANSVTATQLSVGSVTAASLQANSVTSASIQANSITSDKIAANAISASMITAGTINAAISIASGGSITGGPIKTANTGNRIEIGSSFVSTQQAYMGQMLFYDFNGHLNGTLDAGQAVHGVIGGGIYDTWIELKDDFSRIAINETYDQNSGVKNNFNGISLTSRNRAYTDASITYPYSWTSITSNSAQIEIEAAIQSSSSATPDITDIVITDTGITMNGIGVCPKVLFYDENKAMSGPIYLSETAANFSSIELYYKTDNGIQGYTKVFNPNGRVANLVVEIRNSDGVFYVYSKAVQFSETTLNTYVAGGAYFTGLWSSGGTNYLGDYMTVYRVVGYR